MKFVKCNGHIINTNEILHINLVEQESSKKVIRYDITVVFKDKEFIRIARLVTKETADKFMNELMEQLNARE